MQGLRPVPRGLDPCRTLRPPNICAWPRAGPAAPTGNVGGRTSPTAPGGPSARTTARTGTPGATSRTTTPGAAPIAGMRTAWPGSATVARSSAWRWPSGTAATRSSRSASSAWPTREGNHGEDVKEYYFHLDGTPTHSYMRMLYKYPQAEYPYARLVEEAGRRGREAGEFELFDALHDDLHAGRYFDVFVEYAKAGPEDLLCRVTAVNRGPDPAPLHVLPHLWYRNTWSWGGDHERPELRVDDEATVRAGAPAPRREVVARRRIAARLRAPLHRERHERRAPLRRPRRRPLRQGRHPRGRRRRPRREGQPGEAGVEGRRALPCDHRPGRVIRGPPAFRGQPDRPPFRGLRRDPRAATRPKPTSSTTRSTARTSARTSGGCNVRHSRG